MHKIRYYEVITVFCRICRKKRIVVDEYAMSLFLLLQMVLESKGMRYENN